MGRAGIIGLFLASSLFGAVQAQTHAADEGNRHFQSELRQFLSRNAALEIGEYELAATRADIEIVKSEKRPQLILSGSAGYVEQLVTSSSVLSDRSSDGSARLTVSQLLYDGGNASQRRRVREASSEAAKRSLDARFIEAINLAADHYFTLAAVSGKIGIRETGIRLLERVQRENELKFDIGEGTRTEIGFSSARLASRQRDLHLERFALEAASETYRHAFGALPLALNIDPPSCAQLPQSFEAFEDRAVQQNPALLVALAEESEASLAVEAARTVMGPRLSLEGGAVARRTDLGGFFDRQSSLGLEARLNLNMPLSSGRRKSAMRDKARQTYLVTSVRRQEIYRQLALAATLQWSEYQMIKDALSAAEKAVGYAELALEGASKERDAGLRSGLDVLRAEEGLLAAKVARVDLQARLSRSQVGLITASHQFDCFGLDVEKAVGQE